MKEPLFYVREQDVAGMDLFSIRKADLLDWLGVRAQGISVGIDQAKGAKHVKLSSLPSRQKTHGRFLIVHPGWTLEDFAAAATQLRETDLVEYDIRIWYENWLKKQTEWMDESPDEPKANPTILDKEQRLLDLVRESLTPDLRSPEWEAWAREQPDAMALLSHPTAGHCYVAAEALWHLLGAQHTGYHLASAKDYADQTHWWVEDGEGNVFDPTADQYFDFGRRPPYAAGQRRAPAGPSPSERAKVVIDKVEERLKPKPVQMETFAGKPLYDQTVPEEAVASRMKRERIRDYETRPMIVRVGDRYYVRESTIWSGGQRIGRIWMRRDGKTKFYRIRLSPDDRLFFAHEHPDMYPEPEHSLKIDDPRTLQALVGLGLDMNKEQLTPPPPDTLAANLQAYQVLQGLGPGSAGLTLDQLLPGAGRIVIDRGNEKHVFNVWPTGQVVLDSSTAKDQTARWAHDHGIRVTDYAGMVRREEATRPKRSAWESSKKGTNV